MVNLLINSGIDINMNENKKEDLLYALNIYQAYGTAQKEGEESNEAQQLKQEKDKHQTLIMNILK